MATRLTIGNDIYRQCVVAAGEGDGAPRVQVPRRVGVVRRAHVLARAAALRGGGRGAARQVPARQARAARGARRAAARARPDRPPSAAAAQEVR